jgi:hypothetical protein
MVDFMNQRRGWRHLAAGGDRTEQTAGADRQRLTVSTYPPLRFDFIDLRYLAAVGVLLLIAFIAVGGNLGLQAPWLLIAAAWSLHLLVGLALLRGCVIGLARWRPAARWPDLVLLTASGMLTSVLFAPVSFAIDQALLMLGVINDDPPLFSATAIGHGLFEEWAGIVGPSVSIALLLGLPGWWTRRRGHERAPASMPGPKPRDTASAPPDRLDTGSCLARLPPALGTDLIAARAELQYVRVYTTRGEALILGALKDIAAHGPAGQLVHRSWWVANDHVQALRRRAARCMLTLSNGLEVPVSRRRQPSLIDQFGSTASLDAGA